MMKIGAYSVIYGEDLEKFMLYCNQLDIEAVGVPCRSVPGYEEKGYVDAQALGEMKKRFEERGLKIGLIDLYPREETENDPDYLCRTIEAAGECGIETFNYFAVDEKPEDSAQAAEGWRRLVNRYEKMAVQAEKSRVKIATHGYFLPQHHVCNCETLNKLLVEVPSPYNGVTACLGSWHVGGDDASENIRRFGSKVFFVHARGVRGRLEKHEEVLLSKGEVDYRQALQALKDVGFEGVICAEHLPSVVGQTNDEISQAWAIGYLRGILSALE